MLGEGGSLLKQIRHLLDVFWIFSQCLTLLNKLYSLENIFLPSVN